MHAVFPGVSPDARPVGYPVEEERVVVLKDGRRVQLRPVVPDDVDALRLAIKHADPETVRRRFLGGGPPRSEASLRRLVEVDYGRRFALAAFGPTGEGVGIARYEGERTWPTVDVAVVVRPEWRGVGLGTHLVRAVVRRAVQQGATAVSVDFFASNITVQRLVAAAHLPEQRSVDHGVVADTIDLRPLARGSSTAVESD